MKYLKHEAFQVPGCSEEAYNRIFGKRSSSLKDARAQDARNRPATKEQKCPNQS